VKRLYYELVIEGPTPFIRGFVWGVVLSRKVKAEVYECKEHEIDRQSFKHLLIEWFGGYRNITHMVISKRVRDVLIPALELGGNLTGLTVKSCREILHASFEFSFRVYSSAIARDLRNIMGRRGNQVKINYTKFPKEIKREEASKI
jgi:hypothetical protein